MILVLDGSSGGPTLVTLASPEGDVVNSALASGTGELAAKCGDMVDGRAVFAVAAVCGPGTYTGTRIAMAAALGFAGATGVPVFGMSSLDVAVSCVEVLRAGKVGVPSGEAGDAGGGLAERRGREAALPEGDPVALAVREAGRSRFFVVAVPCQVGSAALPSGRLHLVPEEVLLQWPGVIAGDFGISGWYGRKADSLALRAAAEYSAQGFLRAPMVQQFGPTALTPSLPALMDAVRDDIATFSGVQEAGSAGPAVIRQGGGES